MSGRLLGRGFQSLDRIAGDRHDRKAPVRSVLGLRNIALRRLQNPTIPQLELRAVDPKTGRPIRAVSDISAGYDFYVISPNFDIPVAEGKAIGDAEMAHTLRGSLLFGLDSQDFSQRFAPKPAAAAHHLAQAVRTLAMGCSLYLGGDELLPDVFSIIGRNFGIAFRAPGKADPPQHAIFAGLAERAYAWGAVLLLAQGKIAAFERELDAAEQWGTTPIADIADTHRITDDVMQCVVAPHDTAIAMSHHRDGRAAPWKLKFFQADAVQAPDVLRDCFKFQRDPDFVRNFISRTGLALESPLQFFHLHRRNRHVVALTHKQYPWMHYYSATGYIGSTTLSEFYERTGIHRAAGDAVSPLQHEVSLA